MPGDLLAGAVEDVEVIGHEPGDLLHHQGVLLEETGRGGSGIHRSSVPPGPDIP